ncbi:MAG TPA: hypothetical protein VNR17_07245 [Luteimicrobium sp.]|nr:hypothetical protein [Luteimicrobium sp.]
MTGHDLGRLNSGSFQSLVSALVLTEFGAGGTVPMGRGRDGGRDCIFQGPLTWRDGDGQPVEVWDGYTVFQSKFKETLAATPRADAAWLWGEIREELDAWIGHDSDRYPQPDQLVFVTNVALTPVPVAGGYDTIRANLSNYRAKLEDDTRDIDDAAAERRRESLRRLKRIKTITWWDGNKVDALLTKHQGVRQRFDPLLTISDVFSTLAALTGYTVPTDARKVLFEFAHTELSTGGLLYFDEAGSGSNQPIPVHQVAIDLPCILPNGQRGRAFRHLIDRGDLMLSRDLTSLPGPCHVVLTGQPGNGKTTVSKLLTQAYRAAALEGNPDLSMDNRAIIEGTKQVLGRLGVALPRNKRWPIRVDLAKFAQGYGLKENPSLLRFIAEHITERVSAGTIQPNVLDSWMREWSWVVVLDGFDEVTEARPRRAIVEMITEFCSQADSRNYDVFIILTTRPVGYTENVLPSMFETVALDDLEPQEAVDYAVQATRARLGDEPERIARVRRDLEEKANGEGTRRLLRTPLQALILSIIADNAGASAADRYTLYYTYYDTVFKREREKTERLRYLLTTHGPSIKRLHERAGFELQKRAEESEHSHAVLTESELRGIARRVLMDRGLNQSVDETLDEILKAAKERLVLLAERDGEYGFDVRSLQELLAALHLANAAPAQVEQRLRLAAPSPHWRNTWLFVAGKRFAAGTDHEQQATIELVEHVDERADHRLGDLFPVGPLIALDMLDDGMARGATKLSSRLVDHSMRILSGADQTFLGTALRVWLRYAELGDGERRDVVDGLRRALRADQITRDNAAKIQEMSPGMEDALSISSRTRGRIASIRPPSPRTQTAPEPDWETALEEVATAPLPEPDRRLLLETFEALRTYAARDKGKRGRFPQLEAASMDGPMLEVLSGGLAHVVPTDPSLATQLSADLVAALNRKPVGHFLA